MQLISFNTTTVIINNSLNNIPLIIHINVPTKEIVVIEILMSTSVYPIEQRSQKVYDP